MKKLAFILLLGISFVSKSQIPTNGLIGAWTFSGNANDVSGNGNNSTVVNATLTTDRCGNANSAYLFNGTSSSIVMTSGGPLGSLARSGAFWVKTTNPVLSPVVAFDYGFIGSGSIPTCWQVVSNYGCVGYGIDVSSYAVQKGSNCVNDGAWHHVAVVFNPTISTQVANTIVYIDGVVQPTLCEQGSPTFVNTQSLQPVTIGKSAHANNRYFNGALDDFYFYNVALTSTEVLQLYNLNLCSNAVSGNSLLCANSTSSSILYSIAAIPGTTSYSWNFPSGWTGSSSSNSIVMTPGSNAGTISVVATNSCGTSRSYSLQVNMASSPTLNVSSTKTLLCSGSNATINATGAINYTLSPNTTFSSSTVISPTVTTIYTVTGISANGCTKQSVLTQSVSKCTGVENLVLTDSDVLIYPNPFNANFNVELKGINKIYLMEVINVLGQTILSKQSNEITQSVNLETYPKGIYYLSIRNKDILIVKKIVKE